jgi:3-oxoacyl-[acyl-carrier-protein] synthase II
MGAMCNKKFSKPSESSRPFDKDRAGFILGEGSGILVLEEFEHALKRNAKIYCELVGYGNTSDGFHLTRPQDDGDGAYRAMKAALNMAEVSADKVDMVNCHATSTPAGDLCEAKAIYRLIGENMDSAKKTLVTANKSSFGHCFGAAGSVEAIMAILSVYYVRILMIMCDL